MAETNHTFLGATAHDWLLIILGVGLTLVLGFLQNAITTGIKSAFRFLSKRPIYWSSMWLGAVGMLIALFNVRDTPATGFNVFYIVFGLMVCRHGFKDAMNAPDRRTKSVSHPDKIDLDGDLGK